MFSKIIELVINLSAYTKDFILTFLVVMLTYNIIIIFLLVFYDEDIINSILMRKNDLLSNILSILVFSSLLLPTIFLGYKPNNELGWVGTVFFLLIVAYFIVELLSYIHNYDNSISKKIYEIIMSILVIITIFSPFIGLVSIDIKRFIPLILSILILSFLIRNSLFGEIIYLFAKNIKNKLLRNGG